MSLQLKPITKLSSRTDNGRRRLALVGEYLVLTEEPTTRPADPLRLPSGQKAGFPQAIKQDERRALRLVKAPRKPSKAVEQTWWGRLTSYLV